MLAILPKPHPSPFPRATPKRLGRKTVTVAAGFVVENGIILCADSQETAGDYKFPVEKVEALHVTDLGSRLR